MSLYKMSIEYVFVFYKSLTCQHCVDLAKDWGNFSKTLKIKYPNISILVLTRNEGFIPNFITVNCSSWFPMFLFMKLNTWNLLIGDQLDNFNDIKILNGIFNNGKVTNVDRYKSDHKTAIMSFIDNELRGFSKNIPKNIPKNAPIAQIQKSLNNNFDLFDYDSIICDNNKMNIISKNSFY